MPILGLRLSLPGLACRNGSGLSPTQRLQQLLFSNGEQGVFYAPQPVVDGQQVLFTDAAGTIPVTADGDPVGLMLDLSGNGNHASQSVSLSRPKYPGLDYDGVDDTLNCGGDRSIKPANITVCAWVRFNTAENDVRLLSDWHQLGTEDRWLVYIGGGRVRWFTSSAGDLSGPYPTLGAWTHFVMTISSTTSSMYVNGALFSEKATQDTALIPGSTNYSVMLGKQLETGSGLDGQIGEVIIIDRALTPEEVSLVYDNKA